MREISLFSPEDPSWYSEEKFPKEYSKYYDSMAMAMPYKLNICMPIKSAIRLFYDLDYNSEIDNEAISTNNIRDW